MSHSTLSPHTCVGACGGIAGATAAELLEEGAGAQAVRDWDVWDWEALVRLHGFGAVSGTGNGTGVARGGHKNGAGAGAAADER